MAIPVPETAVEIEDRARADYRREVPGSNPWLPNSFFAGIISAVTNRIFDFYLALTDAIAEGIPDSADDNLARWAAIWDVTRLPATGSAGRLHLAGTVGSAIVVTVPPTGTTLFTDSDGNTYEVTSVGDFFAQIALSVDKIERTGSTATLTTDAPHGLGGSGGTILNGFGLTVTGSAISEYNVIECDDLVITGEKTLAYTVAGTPASDDPSAATLAMAGDPQALELGYLSLPVRTVDDVTGVGTNHVLADELTLTSPPAGVRSKCYVQFGGLTGGTSEEANEDLRDRYLFKLRNPVAHFNVAEINKVAKAGPSGQPLGVTRVFVDEGLPALGQVTVYVMIDGRDDPIPTGAEVLLVQEALFSIKPANMADADLIVLAPTRVTTAYDFTALAPDSASMRLAVIANLEAYYRDQPLIATNITENAFNSVIFNTIDPVTGLQVTSFTLSAPPGDITVGAASIGLLGAVTFSI